MRSPLGQLVAPGRPRVSPAAQSDLPFLGMEHVQARTMKILGSVSAKQMKSASVHFQPGDVLYGRLRPYLNKVARPDFEGFCSAEFIVFPESPHLCQSFLQYRLNATDFVSYASHLNDGDRPRVDFQRIAGFEVAVPPIEEQHRIVAKIEELFTQLDTAVAALERVRINLKRHRASILKAAVEGKLTEAWRAAHPDVEPASELLRHILTARQQRREGGEMADYPKAGKTPPNGWPAKYKEPGRSEAEGLPALPAGWCWATLSQLGDLDRGRSRHRPRNAAHLYGGPYPFVQTGDVRQADTFVRTFHQTYSQEGFAQSRLWPAGTLCITIAANIAETAILSFEACFPDSVVGFLASDTASARYVELYLRTVRDRLEQYAPATAQKNINLETLRVVAVALPPIAEQRQIVAEVDQMLSISAEVETEVHKGLLRAASLRQSILNSAFTGKLVPHDPAEEPPSLLLARTVGVGQSEVPPATW